MTVLHADPEVRFARTWTWTAGGILGGGASLPMLLAPERYSVSDMLEDIICYMRLVVDSIAASDGIMWFELVAPDLAYQLAPAGRFQTSPLSPPQVSKLGMGNNRIVEVVLLGGTLTWPTVADIVVEMVHPALTFVHKERVEPEQLRTIADEIGKRTWPPQS